MNQENNSKSQGQLSLFEISSQDTWSGKTSLGPTVQETRAEQILKQSLKRSQELLSQKSPVYLYLNRDGHWLDASRVWETRVCPSAFAGEPIMLSTGERPSSTTVEEWSNQERPNVVVESRLSQILEVNPHPKYSLSPRACQGILNRAKKRGKELPPPLEQALMNQAKIDQTGTEDTDTECQPVGISDSPTYSIEGNGSRGSHLGNGYKESDVMYTLNTIEQHGVCYGFQGQAGASIGMPICEDTAPTMVVNQVTNVAQTSVEPILLESNQNHATIQTDGVSTTLPASMGEGGGYVPMVTQPNTDKQSTVYGISSYDSNAMKSDNPHSGFYEADTARTLDLNGGNPACNQGGMAVVQPTSENVAFGIDQQGGKGQANFTVDVAPTMAADSHGTPHAVCYGVTAKGNGDAFINPNTHTALSTGGGEPGQGYPCVLQVNTEPVSSSYVNVETEVEVRKYPVDIEKLQDCLRDHKKLSVDEIAEKLNKPKTLVAHWFRKDKYFAIPDADIWFALKELLGIETTEFDESITTFETQVGKYDMQNRIHIGDVSPTLCASSENTLYCVNSQEDSTCLNPWDVQSKHIQPEDGIAESLYAGECRYGGGESYVLQHTSAPDSMVFTQNEREEVRDLQDVAGALSAEPGTHQQTYIAQTFKKDSHAKSSDDGQGWVPTDINDTLNAFDSGETRTPTLVVETPTTYQETTGALCAAGYSKLGTQEAMQDMFVVQSMEVFHCTTENDMSHPLKARDYKDPQIVAYTVDMGAGKSQCGVNTEQSPTLATTHGGEPVVYCAPAEQKSEEK